MVQVQRSARQMSSEQHPDDAHLGATRADGGGEVGNHTEILNVELTPEQLAWLNRGALRILIRAAWVQAVILVVVSVGAGLLGGRYAALSALIGAAAVTVPSLLFTLRLAVSLMGFGKGGAASFFLGEFIKMGATLALLVLGVWLAAEVLVWPALIVGLIVSLKSHYWLLLFNNS